MGIVNCSLVLHYHRVRDCLRSDPKKTASPPSQRQESGGPGLYPHNAACKETGANGESTMTLLSPEMMCLFRNVRREGQFAKDNIREPGSSAQGG